MRNKQLLLNIILSNMINTFLIVYVLANVEALGSIGVLLVMMSSSITALIVSRLLLGKDRDERGAKHGRWKLLFTIASVAVMLLGFWVDDPRIILIGMIILMPIFITEAVKAVKR